jgi:hypothetical protein
MALRGLIDWKETVGCSSTPDDLGLFLRHFSLSIAQIVSLDPI